MLFFELFNNLKFIPEHTRWLLLQERVRIEWIYKNLFFLRTKQLSYNLHKKVIYLEAVVRRSSVKKFIRKNSRNSQKNAWAGASFFKFVYMKTPTQVVSREFCESFINTYFVEHLRTAAPVYSHQKCNNWHN